MPHDVISEFQIHFSNGNKLFVVHDPSKQRFRHYNRLLPMSRSDAESVVLSLCPNLSAAQKGWTIGFLMRQPDPEGRSNNLREDAGG
jgi:hypothetical protein